MNRVYVIDFDGTLTKTDIGYSIIKNFAQGDWEVLDQLWIGRKISTAERAELQWNMLQESPQHILDYVKAIQLTEGFDSFYQYIKSHNDKIVIASDGFNFYINPVLEHHGYLDIEVLCCELDYEDGWNFSFPNHNPACGRCGSCKKQIVERFKDRNASVFYIGDGYSDCCGCLASDLVFAKSYLASYCESHQIPHIKFEDFHDILENLKAMDLPLLEG